jgi:hypothetical protein
MVYLIAIDNVLLPKEYKMREDADKFLDHFKKDETVRIMVLEVKSVR